MPHPWNGTNEILFARIVAADWLRCEKRSDQIPSVPTLSAFFGRGTGCRKTVIIPRILEFKSQLCSDFPADSAMKNNKNHDFCAGVVGFHAGGKSDVPCVGHIVVRCLCVSVVNRK